MRGLGGAIAIAGWIAASVALADPPPPAPTPVPPKVAADETRPGVAPLPADTVVVKIGDKPGAGTRAFGFTHVVVRLTDGTNWASIHGGIFCIPQPSRPWTSGQQQEQIKPYMDALQPEMKSAGYSVDGDPDNIFTPTTSTADLQLGAVITDMHFDFCEPMIGYGNTSISNGSGTMQVEWQVYSVIEQKVVAKIDTTGSAKVDSSAHPTFNTLLMSAFKDNVDQLIESNEFQKALAAPPTDATGVVKPSSLSPISLTGAMAAKGRPVGDAVGSVVLISAGQTEGSGFLVSADGLLLTDQHVVGDAKYVKVTWADGMQGLGEVVRTDKTRDVALVKTDSRERQPLRIRRDPLQPGDTVFAIGAPLGDKFQSTVTRGVISAYRTFEGLSFIQSDVSVTHGSSGGPLLNEQGEVVGLTEAGIQPTGAPMGINLFTPIGDALDFLSAQPQ